MSIIRIAGSLATLLVLVGCESTTRIEARDQRAFIPTVKASFNFGKGVDAPSRPQDGHSVEIEAAGAKGSDVQSLGAGASPVVLGGQTFNPPQQLQHDFKFQYADLTWRWRRFFGGGSLGLEALAGLGYAAAQISTSSPAPLQASQGFYTRGAQGGMGLVWRGGSGTSVQLRLTEFASLRSGVSRVSRAEVFLNQALADHVTLRIGYAGWDVFGESLSSNSDFRLRFSGPALGLQFDLGP